MLRRREANVALGRVQPLRGAGDFRAVRRDEGVHLGVPWGGRALVVVVVVVCYLRR